MYEQNVIEALAEARAALRHMGLEQPERLSGTSYQGYAAILTRAVNVLDNAGVFAALDEQTDYASAEEILAESARMSLEDQYPNTLDPAEWGDTTSADVVGRHRRIPVDEPLVGSEAKRMREAVAVLGPLEPEPECTCPGRPSAAHPSLHAGTCPVWAQHHNLT